MININTITVLKTLYQHLSKSGIEWFVTGKTNLVLQGININPTRVGILIRHKDLESFLKLFSDFEQSNIEVLKNGEAWELILFIDGMEVLVCAEYDHGSYWLANDNPVKIQVDDIKIPCLSLVAEKKAYEKMGKKKIWSKFKKLKKFCMIKIRKVDYLRTTVKNRLSSFICFISIKYKPFSFNTHSLKLPLANLF